MNLINNPRCIPITRTLISPLFLAAEDERNKQKQAQPVRVQNDMTSDEI
jgi:hypothetical protein